MIKRSLVGVCAGALIAVSSLALTASPAEATHRKCVGSKSQGVCYTVSSTLAHRKVAETVTFENKFKKHKHKKDDKKIVFTCGFEKSITRNIEVGIKVSAGAKASLFKLVDVDTSVEVHTTLSQSSSQATKLAGSFTLWPGEKAKCQRTYSWVQSKVVASHYSGSSVWTEKYTIKVPSKFGVSVDEL